MAKRYVLEMTEEQFHGLFMMLMAYNWDVRPGAWLFYENNNCIELELPDTLNPLEDLEKEIAEIRKEDNKVVSAITCDDIQKLVMILEGVEEVRCGGRRLVGVKGGGGV